MRSVATNPYLESIREAYRASPAYRRLNGPDKNVAGQELPAVNPASREESTTEKTASTEPFRDSAQQPAPATPALGIPWDDLEREFADRMEP